MLPAGSSNFERQLHGLQIIIAAMTIGPLIFMLITLFLPARPTASFGTIGGLPLLTMLGVFLAFSLRLAARLFLKTMEASACRKIAAGTWRPLKPNPALDDLSDDNGKLLVLYRQSTIMNAATTEGPAFFFLIAYNIERHPLALAIAVLLLADLVSRIPTRARMEKWVAIQSDVINQNRK